MHEKYINIFLQLSEAKFYVGVLFVWINLTTLALWLKLAEVTVGWRGFPDTKPCNRWLWSCYLWRTSERRWRQRVILENITVCLERWMSFQYCPPPLWVINCRPLIESVFEDLAVFKVLWTLISSTDLRVKLGLLGSIKTRSPLQVSPKCQRAWRIKAGEGQLQQTLAGRESTKSFRILYPSFHWL